MCNCPENTNPCPDNTTPSNFISWNSIIDKPNCFTPCVEDLDGIFVPISRTITINGEEFDLSEDRTFTINYPENLADLDDVDVTGLLDGQILIYDSATSTWLPGSLPSATAWSLSGNSESDILFGTLTTEPITFITNGSIRGRWNSSGNFGIFGTSNAFYQGTIDSKLTIFSDNIGTADNEQTLITLVSPNRITANTGAAIEFVGTNASTRFGLAKITGIDYGTFRGGLAFFTDPGTENRSYIERMRITDTGTFGFNTSSPSTTYDFTFSSALTARFYTPSGGSTLSILSGANTGSFNINSSASFNFNTSATKYNFRQSSTDWFDIGATVRSYVNFQVDGGTVLNKYLRLVTNNQTLITSLPYNVAGNDNTLVFDSSSHGNCNLPAASSNIGRILIIHNTDATVTITPAGADVILGVAAVTSGHSRILVAFNSTTWLSLSC
jgi:hypothetical protein